MDALLIEKIHSNSFKVIIQGSGLNVDRGIEEAIEAILLLENVDLLIVGDGDVLPKAKKIVANLSLEKGCIFW